MDLFLYHSSENSKDGLARNQDYMFEWSDMFTRGLLCQLASKKGLETKMQFLKPNCSPFMTIHYKIMKHHN
jgi:hypothetical protein